MGGADSRLIAEIAGGVSTSVTGVRFVSTSFRVAFVQFK